MVVLEKFLSYLATGTLWVMGWELHPTSAFKEFSKINKAVLIFPHTTRFDFVIFALYRLAYPEEMRNFYTVMKPQLANGIFKEFFSYFNALPATRRQERGHGFVSNVVRKLENKYEAFVLISPEGTIAPNEWKTGYYYIAQGLKCPICVTGLDYNKHRLVASNVIVNSIDTLEVVEPILVEEMSKLPVLYKDNSIVHENSRTFSTSLLDMDRFLLRGFVPSLAFLGMWYPYASLLGFVTLYSLILT